MSCRRQVEVRLARIAAVRPPRVLPTKRLFFRLCQDLHNRNYVQFRIMSSPAANTGIAGIFIDDW
jgi:hypothetical protein